MSVSARRVVIKPYLKKKKEIFRDVYLKITVYSRPSPTERQLIPVAFVSEKWFEISC